MKRLTMILALMLALILMLSACQQSPTDGAKESSGPEEETSTAEGSETSGDLDMPSMPLRDPIPDKVVASLAGNEASSLEYGYFYLVFQNNLEYNAMMMGYSDMEEFWSQDMGGVTLRQMLRDEALRSSKDFAVFHKLAKESNTVVGADITANTDAQIDDLLTQFEGDEQEFLNSYGLTPEQMKMVYQRINLVNQYQQDAIEAIEVPENEIRAIYDQDSASYDLVTVRHVLVNCADTMTQEEQDAAKQKADALLAQVQGGEDIGALAAAQSDDGGSAQNNGEYTFGRGEMVTEFEDWAYAASVGDQGMVKSQYGYHIMQMMGRTGYEDVKEEIEHSLQEEKFREVYAEEYDMINNGSWEVDEETIDLIAIV